MREARSLPPHRLRPRRALRTHRDPRGNPRHATGRRELEARRPRSDWRGRGRRRNALARRDLRPHRFATWILNLPVFGSVDPPRSQTFSFSHGSTHRDLEPSRFRMGRPTEISNLLVFAWVDPPRSRTVSFSDGSTHRDLGPSRFRMGRPTEIWNPPGVAPDGPPDANESHAAPKRGVREAERLRSGGTVRGGGRGDSPRAP